MVQRQCQTILITGEPCRRPAAPDSDYCEVCAEICGSKESNRLYNLAVGQKRSEQFSKHSDAHNLKNELALARLLCERKYNGIASEGEDSLERNAGLLLDMLRKVADLAVQGDALARKRGELLDKSRVTSLAEALIACVTDVIHELVEDEALQGEILTAIGNSFFAILKKELQC
jgi:hypothetical protein